MSIHWKELGGAEIIIQKGNLFHTEDNELIVWHSVEGDVGSILARRVVVQNKNKDKLETNIEKNKDMSGPANINLDARLLAIKIKNGFHSIEELTVLIGDFAVEKIGIVTELKQVHEMSTTELTEEATNLVNRLQSIDNRLFVMED